MSDEPSEPAPETARRKGILAEWREAVTPHAFGLVVGVLLLQLAFILSYAGAFHNPKPHRMSIGVVVPAGAPADTARQTVTQLNAIKGEPLHASVVTDESAARQGIKNRDLAGALILGTGKADRLLVASAEGGSLSSALDSVLTAVDASQQRTLAVDDIVPAAEGDARGLTAFYLAVGWVVGGYLVASILAISAGALPSNVRRARVRLGALLAYSIASGLGGALIVGPVLGALDRSFWTLSGFGALIVFAVGAFTMAVQALTGVVGIGIAVLLFVVLGNPSAGGAYPGPLLPGFWRAIGPLLPPGAGTSAVRGIVYFDNAGVGGPLLVVLIYAAAGAGALLAVSRWRKHPPEMAQSGG
ncbi:MAG: DUF3533 domain-containing protein [Jatrophihabitantaceae bacterium]